MVLTNTMFASTLSQRSIKCVQIFSSNFQWSHSYPIKTKGQVHEALSLMFQCEGVPLLMVMDSSKEQTLGKFHLKEFKTRAGLKFLLTNTCHRLWGD